MANINTNITGSNQIDTGRGYENLDELNGGKHTPTPAEKAASKAKELLEEKREEAQAASSSQASQSSVSWRDAKHIDELVNTPAYQRAEENRRLGWIGREDKDIFKYAEELRDKHAAEQGTSSEVEPKFANREYTDDPWGGLEDSVQAEESAPQVVEAVPSENVEVASEEPSPSDYSNLNNYFLDLADKAEHLVKNAKARQRKYRDGYGKNYVQREIDRLSGHAERLKKHATRLETRSKQLDDFEEAVELIQDIQDIDAHFEILLKDILRRHRTKVERANLAPQTLGMPFYNFFQIRELKVKELIKLQEKIIKETGKHLEELGIPHQELVEIDDPLWMGDFNKVRKFIKDNKAKSQEVVEEPAQSEEAVEEPDTAEHAPVELSEEEVFSNPEKAEQLNEGMWRWLTKYLDKSEGLTDIPEVVVKAVTPYAKLVGTPQEPSWWHLFEALVSVVKRNIEAAFREDMNSTDFVPSNQMVSDDNLEEDTVVPIVTDDNLGESPVDQVPTDAYEGFEDQFEAEGEDLTGENLEEEYTGDADPTGENLEEGYTGEASEIDEADPWAGLGDSQDLSEEEDAAATAILNKMDEYRSDKQMRIDHEYELYDKYRKFRSKENLWQIFDGFEKNEEGTEQPGEDLAKCFVRFCKLFRAEANEESFDIFISIMTSFLGVNPDRHNLLFGEKQDGKRLIPVGTVSLALDSMERNIRDGRYFFAYRHKGLKLYGTPCFPVPIFGEMELAWMTAPGRLYEGMAWETLTDVANNEWLRNIYPRIKKKKDIALQKSYETYVRFMMDYVSNISSGVMSCGEWGVPDIEHAFPSEKIQEFRFSEKIKGLTDTVREVAVEVEDALIREEVFQTKYTSQKWSMRRSSVEREIRENGHTEYEIAASETQIAVTNIVEGAAKAAAGLSVFGDVALAGSSTAEAAVGNVEARGVLWLRHQFFSEEEKKEFVMTKELRQILHGSEVYEMISTIKAIDSSFGRIATIRYLYEETVYTPETATAWIQERYGSRTAKKTKNGLSEGKWLAKMNKFYDAMQSIQTGEWLARRYDAELFVDAFLVNQCKKKRKSGESDVYFTEEELKQSFILDPRKTIRDIFLTREGLQAYAWSQLRTLGGNSVVAARYERYANEHRIAGSAIRMFVANFPVFLLNATSRLNPLLHTTQLLSLKLRSQLNKKELYQQDFYEMLATDDFIQALQLDMLNAPGCIGKILVCCAIFALIPGDFDEPEDKKKKGMCDEYVFGVLYDDDGNRIIGSGFRAREMWYMFDITGWACPASIAIYGYFTGTMSLSTACAVLADGMNDIVFDLAPGEFVNMLHDFDKTWQQAQALAYEDGLRDPESLVSPETAIDYLGSMFSISSLDFVTRKITPRVVREFMTSGWGPDFIAPDPTKVYTPDPNDGDKTMYVEDWTERNLRIKSSRNPLMGVLLNIASGYYWNEDPTKQMTGYGPEDMPDMEKPDPAHVTWYNRYYDVQGEYKDGQFVGSEESILAIEEIFRMVDAVGAKVPEDQVGSFLAQNSVCLPARTQYAMVGYCYAQLNDIQQKYRSGQIDYDSYSEQYDYYQSKIDLVNSGVIPDKPIRYKQWETDYQAYYKDSDGNYHTELEYHIRNAPILGGILDLLGVEDLEVEFSPYGNYSTPAQFISTVAHATDSTYDAQTKAAWQGDFTDPEFVKELCEGLDLVVELGPNAGKNVWEVITGDEQAFQADGSIEFVMGSRAYTPVIEPIEYEDDDDDGGGSSGGSGGRSYSGYTYVGAGSYKPKIYSNPRSVNSDRAATMYAKTPYTANRTYLRPAFFTKGSREAYRRQDM